jgi:lipopolysaccharide/colanic/teichoic acid biosynthesis glycosyltransferase
LDELPSFWNVLHGEMSLVGPRPLPIRYLPRYDARAARRHDVKPGITGWAQINGRNAVSWTERLELDVWYVEHQSLGLDLRILAHTGVAVLRREGISHEGHATMPEYHGGNG